ncbi:MAG TPA: tetratricopeptide repeat protein [Verrucomicrobiae bacterium]|nr:tetratricopeptide repeat protein [Verrucomicrobiae bacterium]
MPTPDPTDATPGRTTTPTGGSSGTESLASRSRWLRLGILAATCALVIGVYECVVQPGSFELGSSTPADSYYNLLVQGVRAGQLSVNREAPPDLARLPNPYDLSKYSRISGLLDFSYYQGRLYLYFGVVPALILFWPFNVLSGQYLFHRQAVVIFSAIGFLVSVGLLGALWRRYFTEVSVGVVVACALALGLASGVPVLLSQADVWEVPISCGYMLLLMALGAIWCALHEPGRRVQWLAAASATYGLALGARPSLLLGAIVLLVPVAQARRERRPVIGLLVAAIVPVVLAGLGVMLYNAQRFGNPFEFGLRYQLHAEPRIDQQFFGLQHVWFNLRAYFLEPTRWTVRSPFVLGVVLPPAPIGHGNVQNPFGILTNVPIVWLALAVPLAWRDRWAASASLRWFLAAVVLIFGIEALTLGLYYCTAARFEVEFLPALMLLAVVGILGLERAWSDRPFRRQVARWGWGLLLGVSVLFNLLAGLRYYAESQTGLGNALVEAGKVLEAFKHFQRALWIDPNLAETHESLGAALAQLGRLPEAIAEYERALRIKPGYVEAYLNLGSALTSQGRMQDAMAQYEEVARIRPDYPDTYESLGIILARLNRLPEAIAEYERALRINPDFAEAHNNLGIALARMGKAEEAIAHFERALQLKPEYAEAHYNCGKTLEQTGRVHEAIVHFEQALRIEPTFTPARDELTRLHGEHQ